MKKKKTIQIKAYTGIPYEHVESLDDVIKFSKTTKSRIVQLLIAEFLENVRKYQTKLDKCEPLRLDHDLAKTSALSMHLMDEMPFKVYFENMAKPEEERIYWTWEPEIVTPAKGGK